RQQRGRQENPEVEDDGESDGGEDGHLPVRGKSAPGNVGQGRLSSRSGSVIIPRDSTPARRATAMISTTCPYGSDRSACRYSSFSFWMRTLVESLRSRSAPGISVLPRNTRRSRVMVSTSFSSWCSICCVCARGRSTFTPLWMRGAVTMKMMSNTSMTSTSGVTLMSVIALRPDPVSPPEKANSRRLLEDVALDDVEEVGGEVAHLVLEDADPRVECVVSDQRGHRRKESHRGGDQGLADGPRHGGEIGVSHLVDVAECPHDPPHRAEEADEGRRRGGGPEERDARFQRGQFGVRGAAQGALHVLESGELVVHGGIGLGLGLRDLRQLDIAGAKDLRDGRERQLVGDLVDLVEPLAAPERLQETAALLPRAPQLEELAEDDGPAPERGGDEERE